jgi:hypothetical protein
VFGFVRPRYLAACGHPSIPAPATPAPVSTPHPGNDDEPIVGPHQPSGPGCLTIPAPVPGKVLRACPQEENPSASPGPGRDVSEGGVVHLRHELRPSNSVVDGTANGHRHEFELHVLRKYVLWSTIYV